MSSTSASFSSSDSSDETLSERLKECRKLGYTPSARLRCLILFKFYSSCSKYYFVPYFVVRRTSPFNSVFIRYFRSGVEKDSSGVAKEEHSRTEVLSKPDVLGISGVSEPGVVNMGGAPSHDGSLSGGEEERKSLTQ